MSNDKSWSGGYVSDVSYTYGYYSELNPLRASTSLALSGFAPPEITHACELGFGHGISINSHAAASSIKWWGTDFNPSQASFAKELASSSEVSLSLYDQSFKEFTARDDLPDFDFIGLHGIWSWISDENRSLIVSFIKRRLKVGGVLYLSYNTQPGWASFTPMRHLLAEHVKVCGANGQDLRDRIGASLNFAERLLGTNPSYGKVNPTVAQRLKEIQGLDKNYLAHEYFNLDWHPMHFSTVAKWLAPAKLQYACSADTFDAIDVLNHTEEQQGLLSEIHDKDFLQTVRDFMVNRQFRKDYWIRGARSINQYEQYNSLRSQRFILTTPQKDLNLEVSASLGKVRLSEEVYIPIITAMAEHQVMTVAELESFTKGQVTFPQLRQAMTVLMGAGHIAPAQKPEFINEAMPSTSSLNKLICRKARGSSELSYLVSPVTGGGVPVSRFGQLFLTSIETGKSSAQECAKYAWEVLFSQNERLVVKGKTLESDAENLNQLEHWASEFNTKRLPILKALGISS